MGQIVQRVVEEDVQGRIGWVEGRERWVTQFRELLRKTYKVEQDGQKEERVMGYIVQRVVEEDVQGRIGRVEGRESDGLDSLESC